LEVEIITNLDGNLGEILVIKNEIYRVLANSIENSWNALIDKKEIENFEPRIEISSERSENNVIIRVKDNGLGIKEEVKSKIFDPFFSTRKTKQGTGLGLYFVYEIIVNEHEGRVIIESEEGTGTELLLTIPIREKNDSQNT
jgi:signal transduction histidine kinase